MKSELEWLESLHEYRYEPDKIIIAIANRKQELKSLSEGAKNTEQQVQPDNAYRCTLPPPCTYWSANGCCSEQFCINKALQVN